MCSRNKRKKCRITKTQEFPLVGRQELFLKYLVEVLPRQVLTGVYSKFKTPTFAKDPSVRYPKKPKSFSRYDGRVQYRGDLIHWLVDRRDSVHVLDNPFMSFILNRLYGLTEEPLLSLTINP